MPTTNIAARLIEAQPGNILLMLPDAPRYTIVAASKGFYQTSNTTPDKLLGKGVFDKFPNNPNSTDNSGAADLNASFLKVLNTRQPEKLDPFRYDIKNQKGDFEERYWEVIDSPVLGDEGDIIYITHSVIEVTDKVLSEKRDEVLKGMKQAYDLFMQAPFAIHIFTGPDFIIELANAPTLEMWGREGNVIGKSFFEVVPEVKEQGYGDLMNEVMQSGQTRFFYETPIILDRPGKDKVGYYNFVFQPYYKEGSKKAESILIIANEVTTQVIARQKINESEQKYQRLFATMNQGFCVLEMIFEGEKPVDYRFEEINPVFEKQTGLKNAIGKTIRELVPNFEAHWFELYGKVASTGEPASFTEESNAMNRWFDVYAFKVGEDTGRKVAVLFSDITERRKAEDAVRKSEQNLRSLILQAPVAMCILKEPENIVEIANERMFEIWGKTAGEVMERPLFEGLPEAKEQGFEDLLRHVYTTGETFQAFERPANLPRNGKIETTYLNFVYEPFYEVDGQISGIIAVAIDVTEQVLARQKIEEVVAERTAQLAESNLALTRTNQELLNLNASLEQFAYAASHDMQEPLRKIETFSNFLEKETEQLSDRAKSFINKIGTSASRMKTIINDLLQYSNQKFEGIQQNVDLNEVIEQVRNDLEITIQQKTVLISTAPLPGIYAVKGQINQLFLNLISNAIKFAKKDIPAVIIITSKTLNKAEVAERTILNRDIEYVRISISDNGIGFHHDYSEKIFQLFSRLHSKHDYEGTGIGLGLCMKIVQNHKGEIYYFSNGTIGKMK
jgi:PAS domain S-box-containing protein